MLKLFILFTFIILGLFSCASKQDKKFTDQVAPDLVETFNLNDEKFDKFKVEDIKTDNTIEQVASLKNIEPAVVSINVATKASQKVTSKEAVKKTVKEVIEKMESKEVMASTYPEDYPKKYLGHDKKAKKVWSSFRPRFFTGENFVMSLSYLGVTAGHIKIETKKSVMLNKQQAFHFVAQLKSSDFYKYIYELNDTVESYISKDNFLPLKYTLTQRETGQSVDDLQLFDHKKLKTFFWYKKLKKGKTTTRHLERYIPGYFQDSFSSLFFVRGLPLKNGDQYEFPVMTRGKIWLIKMKVSGREIIEIMDEKVSAIKVAAETHFPGVLKKRGDINFWYSDDDNRKLLRFTAKVKIGALKGELVDYKAAP